MDSRVKFVFYFTLHSYVCSVYFLRQNHCIYQYMYFFLLGKITGFLSAKSFLILQIKVRHKVLNRSERVKYMYTCILFVDFIIMIKIQPVRCPIAISLSVRTILFVKSITSISIPRLSFLLKLQLQGVFWFEIRNEPIVWIEVKV